jgi:hypothetical protein
MDIVTHFLTLVLVDGSDPDPVARARHMMRRFWADEPLDEAGQRIPDWKCDGFVVEGRYDGEIWGKEQHYNLTPDQFQQRYGLDVVRPEDNVRPVSELVPDLLPFAVVTPDGDWVDRDGVSEQAWRTAFRALRAKYNERIAVAIDCHC